MSAVRDGWTDDEFLDAARSALREARDGEGHG